MALNHAECVRMVEAFRSARRAAVGRLLPPRAAALPDRPRAAARPARSASRRRVHIQVTDRLASAATRLELAVRSGDRRRRAVLRPGSHCLDLIDFLLGPITDVAGVRRQHRRRLRGRGRDRARPSASATESRAPASGTSTPTRRRDAMTFTGSGGGIAHADLQRRRRRRARGDERTTSFRAQSAARAPAADPDDRRRAARPRTVRVHRRVRRPRVVGDGSLRREEPESSHDFCVR